MRIAIMILCALCLAGCGVHMDAPSNYLKLEHSSWPYEYLAVSSDDCRLSARKVSNPEKGGLEFWTPAIRNQMVEAKGYAFVGEQAVQTRGGWQGHEFLFSTHSKGVEYYYLVAFFPVGTTIHLAEAAGERTLIEKDLASLRAAIQTLR